MTRGVSRRRALVAGLPFLAGCSRSRFGTNTGSESEPLTDESGSPVRGSESQPAGRSDRRTTSATDRPTSDTESSGSADAAFELGGTVTHQPDSDEPGRIRLRLTNRGGRRRRLSLGVAPPFSGIVSTVEDGAQLVLLPIGDKAFTSPPVAELIPDRRSDCWTAVHEFGVVQSVGLRFIGPGETLSRRYHVLRSSDSGVCRSGKYEFDRIIERPTGDEYVPVFRGIVSVRVGENGRLSVSGAVRPPS